ncbi:MAG TPA: hypothetical protein VNJ10_13345 [Sphingomonas sp.]|nr:hypothetical protein [Sphingomonas sp.]
MFRTAVLAALIALPAMASAQDAQADKPPQRIRSVTLTGDQKCPASSGGEIVVCSTLDQPYRIPKALREDKPIAAQNQSWVNRAASLDQIGRVAGGLPDTCSAVGTGGQSGCFMARNNAYAAERRAPASETDTTP